ncbi:MAG: prolipoprotein diacylglyceryl transferase [Candidatus Kerfeldbacteria bacterium]|nr:prolipoprotein diacylglyceryl transferase [Candidatus Kerfeldbacteria bacterium]
MITFQPIEFIHLGPLAISTHALLMVIGIALAYWRLRVFAQQQKLPVDFLDTAVCWGVLGGIVGARILYVALNIQLYDSVFDVLKVWEGGLVSFGGLLGGLIGAMIFLQVKKQPVLRWLDAGMLYILLGWAIGRIGDLISWGEIGSPTSLPWGMIVNGDVPRHPAQLYETLLLLIGFAIIRLAHRKGYLHKPGTLFGVALAFYGLNRFIIELVRDYPNSEYWFSYGYFAQGISLILLAVGIICSVLFARRYTIMYSR